MHIFYIYFPSLFLHLFAFKARRLVMTMVYQSNFMPNNHLMSNGISLIVSILFLYDGRFEALKGKLIYD